MVDRSCCSCVYYSDRNLMWRYWRDENPITTVDTWWCIAQASRLIVHRIASHDILTLIFNNGASWISFLCCAEVHQSVARHRHTRRRGINSLVLTSGWWVLAPKATSERTRKPSRQASHQSRSRRKQLEHIQVARPACGRAYSPTRSRNDYTRHRHSSTHPRALNQQSIHSTASPSAISYNEHRQQPPTAGL